MKCPSLSDLPPPDGRTGWPWTVGTASLPPVRPDGSPWPRVSIVTPSFNQGSFIEETIRSVLLQGYPDLEYIVIDGGSSDRSVEIIKKYEHWLTYWISERDSGQAHAINKGLRRCTGEIFQWINSDDFVLPGGMRAIARAYKGNAVGACAVCGYDREHTWLGQCADLSVHTLLTANPGFNQQALWLPREKLAAIGIDKRYNYAFDWDMAIRFLERFPAIDYIDTQVAFFRFHTLSKSVSSEAAFAREKHSIRARLNYSLSNPIHRTLCRTVQHQTNWRRHLTDWRTDPLTSRTSIAMKMIRLALRRPGERIDRYSLGALRRLLLVAREA